MVRSKIASFVGMALLAAITFAGGSPKSMGQEVQGDLSKRVKTRVQPTYPELARRMSIHGNVKLLVTVGANGKVKSTKTVGGHPILVGASEDAIRRWKFESGAEDASGIVEFSFQGDN